MICFVSAAAGLLVRLATAAASALGALVLLRAAWRLLSRLEGRTAAPSTSGGATTLRQRVHRCLEGEGRSGRSLQGILLGLIAVSVGAFVLSTCVGISDSLRGSLDALEWVIVPVFTVEFVLRLWACPESALCPTGSCARLRWLATDVYALLDLASFLPFYVDLVAPTTLNLRVLRMLRALQLLEDAGCGLSTFAGILAEKRKMLLASSFVGGAVWLVCSALYWHFDRGNPAMEICPRCSDPDDRASCDGSEELASCFGRLDTIPGAMYFCLVNLCGEFPLMMEHSAGSRCVNVFIAVVGNAVAGIAMGVLGDGFAEHVEKSQGESESEPAAEVVLPSGPRAQRSRRVLAVMDNPKGPWAAVCALLAISSWVSLLLADHAAASQLKGPLEALVLPEEHVGLLATPEHGRSEALIRIFGRFEVLACMLFLGDYAIRMAAARHGLGTAYASSSLGVVDLLAFAPVLLPVPGRWQLAWLRPLACMARALKLERYLGAFSALRLVAKRSAPVLVTTGLVAAVLLVLFSTLMWVAEVTNPLAEVQGYYESVPKAMWITMLNLSGECPLADYTLQGKLLTGAIGIFAVGVFSIPFGLMSEGFQSVLDEPDDPEPQQSQQQLQQQQQQQSSSQPVRRSKSFKRLRPRQAAVARFLRGSLELDCSTAARAFERVSIAMILISVVLTLVQSGHGFQQRGGTWEQVAEDSAVFWFTLEFLLRLFSAPAEPEYRSRLRYVVSCCGIVDLLSTVPFYLARFSALADRHDEELRLFRMLRLLLLGNHVPSLGLILRVLHSRRRDLQMALYVAVSVWLLFATLLHLAEADDHNPHEMALRFRSVLTSLPFTLIHLTGDYPLVEYNATARLVHVLMLVTAQGMVGIIGGIVASGFTEELHSLRMAQRRRRKKAVEVLGHTVSAWLVQKRWLRMNHGLQLQEQEEQLRAQRAKQRAQFMWRLETAVNGTTWRRVKMILVLASLLWTVARSVPGTVSSAADDAFATGFTLAFLVDYVGKLYSAPVSKFFGMRRRRYVLSLQGLVDLVILGPFLLRMVLHRVGVGQVWGDSFILGVLPSLRVLQLEESVKALVCLGDVWRECKDTVLTSMLLASMVWLFGAVLFFEVEKGNAALGGAMDSIPSALHYTAIFLGGEWAVVDFTPLGQVLCVLYCLFGIAVFAIPVGSFFEAYKAALEEDGERK